MKTQTRREIGTQLSFALYGAASRMNRLHKPFLDPLGLTFPQYLVMLELFRMTPRTVGDIGNSLGMDTGTITPVLKRLERAGRICRTRDSADERRVLITLTDEGNALQDKLWCTGERIASACRLSEAELAELLDALNHFAQPDKRNAG
ncbi:MarR family winged helix-turn-helix transcriptional regulator [Raoultella terrigena]|uniref:Organic hydroperoxide resistance transcriptional regulator n=1 Tax=Raoultella terrigena TaxID=577 RepID=A0A3P8M3Z1_RAOTE|nr:Organic hydroperoxide resistance transcriptional regulator [Raoultella terrigena]